MLLVRVTSLEQLSLAEFSGVNKQGQTFSFLEFLWFFPNFFRSNSFIFEPKVEKINMGVFPLILCH
jgi:hypothetical protein